MWADGVNPRDLTGIHSQNISALTTSAGETQWTEEPDQTLSKTYQHASNLCVLKQ